jgi:hypothetical protein
LSLGDGTAQETQLRNGKTAKIPCLSKQFDSSNLYGIEHRKTTDENKEIPHKVDLYNITAALFAFRLQSCVQIRENPQIGPQLGIQTVSLNSANSSGRKVPRSRGLD